MNDKLFYTKCRPRGVDAWPVAERSRIAFVGYPAYRVDFDPDGFGWRDRDASEWLLDPGSQGPYLAGTNQPNQGYRSQVTRNRRLAREIGRGSIVLVPRPGRGLCFAARVVSELHLARDPRWADEYLKLRSQSGLKVEPEHAHVADVVQVWRVDEWIEISFPALPRWISYRLLSRNTVGVIKDLKAPQVSAHGTLEAIMAVPREEQYGIIGRHRSTERALLDWCTPSSFEHLLVSLLQLEDEREVSWHHIGGSGDGGVDAVAVDPNGRLRGVLQAKLRYGAGAGRLAAGLRERHRGSGDLRIVVAVLHGEHDEVGESFEVWNRRRVARLVDRYREQLPILQSFVWGS